MSGIILSESLTPSKKNKVYTSDSSKWALPDGPEADATLHSKARPTVRSVDLLTYSLLRSHLEVTRFLHSLKRAYFKSLLATQITWLQNTPDLGSWLPGQHFLYWAPSMSLQVFLFGLILPTPNLRRKSIINCFAPVPIPPKDITNNILNVRNKLH